MYCVCNKISFKDVVALITDYEFTLEHLIEQGVCGNKCELCIPLIKKEIKQITIDQIRKFR